MGQLDKIKNGIKAMDNKIQSAEKSYLENRSELGAEQKEKLEEARNKYLLESVTSEAATAKMEKALGAIGVNLHNTYISHVSEAYKPLYDISTSFSTSNRIVYFDITRWVSDSEEKNIEKFINVYQVLANEKCNVALIYDRTVQGCTVTMAVANIGENSMPNIASDYGKRVIEAIYGNFPGAKIKMADEKGNAFNCGVPDCLKAVVEYKDENEQELVSVESVAVITNLATDKSEDFISQSMEKLLDGIVPKDEGQEYRLILLASPSDDIAAQKSLLYDMYNTLSPYASWQESVSTMENTVIGVSGSLNKNIGGNIGVNAGVQAGINFGVNFGKTASHTVSVGETKGETRTCTNYAVKHSLELLEERIKRLEQCSALGMWKFAAYAISKDAVIANNVASMYLALTQGEQSYLSQSAINFWHGTRKKEDAAIILESLKRVHHPRFILDEEICKEVPDIMLFPETTELCTLISGKELVRALNFPRKSIAGLPVIECAEFGRNVLTVDGKNEGEIKIGKIYHMLHKESEEVKLSAKDMTAHTFVTGSTGAGKSNAIYKILEEAVKLKEDGDKVSFMVIEPAKGEYKDVFGTNDNIKADVYGTNPKLTPLLRINPFRFPETTHVYEHMDRLVEIFNVCWSMYAAMPAVLKASLENAYKATGWDLEKSENITGVNIYPTFATVAQEVKKYLDKSEYSDENKGNYKGALLTRLESLANGINGMIFCADDIKDEELFDKNVIVDLSRVGSMDTKALIMGVLIMRLQEYRSGVRLKECQEGKAATNSGLRHITVLEEAHNLLKRTSTEQSAEGANLIGKSVEMLSNSIAEMRTYGEAFIIADQAPGLLDMSVIRNTNTKIVLRLPDYSDRELVGKAANMNEEQITELAKLKTGVAAVYQNNWVSPVLCQFERFNAQEKMYINPESPERQNKRNIVASEVLNIIMKSDIRKKLDNVDFRDKIIQDVVDSVLPDWLKVKILLYIKTKNHKVEQLAKIAYGFFNSEESLEKAASAEDIEKWMDKLTAELKPSVKDYAEEEIDMLLALLVKEHYELNSAYKPIYLSYMEYIGKKRNLI